jgi:hypothetical protein
MGFMKPQIQDYVNILTKEDGLEKYEPKDINKVKIEDSVEFKNDLLKCLNPKRKEIKNKNFIKRIYDWIVTRIKI